jgi:putative ABC transport system permease protein
VAQRRAARPNGPRVAVLSYRAWQDQLGGDRRAIGRTVQLDDRPYKIVGVMPAGFRFVREDVDLWTAYSRGFLPM